MVVLQRLCQQLPAFLIQLTVGHVQSQKTSVLLQGFDKVVGHEENVSAERQLVV